MDVLEEMDSCEDARRVSAPTMIWTYAAVIPGRGALRGDPVWYQGRLDSARALASAIPGARLTIERSQSSSAFDFAPAIKAFLQEDAVSDNEASPMEGLQTILFTDLESSTALTQRIGDERAQELLRGHNAVVRTSLVEHGGHEVKHTGDGIMASFGSAAAAVASALKIQRDLAGGEIRVRVGLNAGEPVAEEGDIFGTAVQLAARITDRAVPGQVLVSDVVRQLCAGKTFEFASTGRAVMKGFDEPLELYEARPAS
jgi:class 3 adenylate cyclase